MENSNISRKAFIRNAALGLTSLSLLPSMAAASDSQKVVENKKSTNNKKMDSYKIKNLRLETGFQWEDQQVVSTKSDLFTIEIDNGVITKIMQNDPLANAVDAKGYLALPMFCDMHIHLDKTFYGEPWKGARPKKGGVKQMIALEQEILPKMLENSTYRAQKLIELLQSKGSGFARSHVNIEPTSELKSLENLEVALKQKQDGFLSELVAFPQHGLFYTSSLPYMKQAAQMGVDYIGGLDPTSIDGALEPTMDATIDLALTYNKGIDIHLHETGDSGAKTFEYLINKVKENPELKGKTYVSHGFALAFMDPGYLNEIATELGDNQIGVISTIPFTGFKMPILELAKKNVKVYAGNDSIIDHWDTTGTGSVLQKANLAAQLYRKTNEFGLSRSLALATKGVLPLNDNGDMQWPKVGDSADLVLIDALCSSEAVSRISDVESLIVQGNIVY
ncbi:amidohydrolase [Myroides sp. LJL119]